MMQLRPVSTRTVEPETKNTPEEKISFQEALTGLDDNPFAAYARKIFAKVDAFFQGWLSDGNAAYFSGDEGTSKDRE